MYAIVFVLKTEFEVIYHQISENITVSFPYLGEKFTIDIVFLWHNVGVCDDAISNIFLSIILNMKLLNFSFHVYFYLCISFTFKIKLNRVSARNSASLFISPSPPLSHSPSSLFLSHDDSHFQQFPLQSPMPCISCSSNLQFVFICYNFCNRTRISGSKFLQPLTFLILIFF